MSEYRVIAQADVWRAELTIGAKQGYEGPEVVTPQDVATHIETFYKDQREGAPDPWYPSIVWTRGTVQGANFAAETVIKVTLESNPLYSPEASEADVRFFAIWLATYLAQKLQQVRVYVAMQPIRSLIVGKE